MKHSFLQALPVTHWYHYQNKASQGALICESKNWPPAPPLPPSSGNSNFGLSNYFIDGSLATRTGEPSFTYGNRSYTADIPDGSDVTCAYSDRIHGWDSKRYDAACKIAGTGCQGWAEKLPKLSEEDFLRFAAVALNIEGKKIFAARAVHHYNVSNGYSCPTIEAIYVK